MCESEVSSRELVIEKIKLYVEFAEQANSYCECFPQFDVRQIVSSYGLNIFSLTSILKNMGFSLDGRAIAYYSNDAQMYVNCGVDPIHPDYHIPIEDIQNLKLKCSHTGISLIHMIMSEEMNETVNKIKEIENAQDSVHDNKQCRRTKERRIGYIIEKVSKWREYYNGIPDPVAGQLKRYTLEEAAQQVQISKKSLDDYLLQIRYGRKYGFNFNEHRNEKVGVLRAFVKKHNLTNLKKKKKVKIE